MGNVVTRLNMTLACRCRSLLICAVGLLAASTTANAQSYVFTELSTPGGGATLGLGINNSGQVAGIAPTTVGGLPWAAIRWDGATPTELGTLGGSVGGAYAINNSGQVAGYSLTAGDADFRAAIWTGNTATDLAGTSSFAYAINDSSQVAGYTYFAGDAGHHATVWNGTNATDLGTLAGDTNSAGLGINNSGQVVGWSRTAVGAQRAVLWNGTNATALGTLGGTFGMAYAVNDSGQAVGASSTQFDAIHHATLWDGDAVIDLGSPGVESYAYAINNSGQVVGRAGGDQHGMLWSGGIATNLNDFLDADAVSAGWFLMSALDINDSGWITGYAYNALTNQLGGYVLSISAVPEPSSFPLALVGMGVLGLMFRLRRDNSVRR